MHTNDVWSKWTKDRGFLAATEHGSTFLRSQLVVLANGEKLRRCDWSDLETQRTEAMQRATDVTAALEVEQLRIQTLAAAAKAFHGRMDEARVSLAAANDRADEADRHVADLNCEIQRLGEPNADLDRVLGHQRMDLAVLSNGAVGHPQGDGLQDQAASAAPPPGQKHGSTPS